MDLYAQQARNRRLTFLLMGAFILLFVAVGLVIDYAYTGPSGVSLSGVMLPIPLFTSIALGFGGLGSVTSYFYGDKMVLASMSARPLDETRLEERQLKNVVEEMAIASGLPMPAIYVLPDEDPNAFATGRDPQHATIGVTEGLLKALDREELQAVVAHEMGHIHSLDIRTMTIVGVLLGAIAMLSDLAVRASYSSGRRSSSRRGGGGALILIAIIVGIVAPLIARMLAMAVSRTREYEADRSAAEFTRNPLALARALSKLEAHHAPTKVATQGTAHLFVVDPRISKLNDREDRFSNLFATHPPLKQRISRLEKMGYGTLSKQDRPTVRSDPEIKSFRRQ